MKLLIEKNIVIDHEKLVALVLSIETDEVENPPTNRSDGTHYNLVNIF